MLTFYLTIESIICKFNNIVFSQIQATWYNCIFFIYTPSQFKSRRENSLRSTHARRDGRFGEGGEGRWTHHLYLSLGSIARMLPQKTICEWLTSLLRKILQQKKNLIYRGNNSSQDYIFFLLENQFNQNKWGYKFLQKNYLIWN